jgi:predicted DNA-binding transcriptional regulator AlpA
MSAATAPTISNTKLLYKVPDAAKLLGISERSLWKYVNTEIVRSVRLGPKLVRVPLAELQRLAGLIVVEETATQKG